MKLIAGLGNPGLKYSKTRHNLGFRVIDALVKNHKRGFLIENKKFQAETLILAINHEQTIMAKPQTQMNNSGNSIKALVNYYKIVPEDVLIIHDDIDLPLGELRLHKGRGSAGHKGVQSIIDNLQTNNFLRIRMGIAGSIKLDIGTEEYVLQKFNPSEEIVVAQAIKKAVLLATEAFLNS